jgi:hypothetical protein
MTILHDLAMGPVTVLAQRTGECTNLYGQHPPHSLPAGRKLHTQNQCGSEW